MKKIERRKEFVLDSAGLKLLSEQFTVVHIPAQIVYKKSPLIAPPKPKEKTA